MAITAETRQDIIELVVTAYGVAPGTTLLTELVAIIDDGGTLADVADELTSRSEWTSVYPSFQTAEEFSTEWLGNLLPEASADTLAVGVDIAVGLINGGASFGSLIMAAQDFLSNLAEDDAEFGVSAANFNNKSEAATYYTITLEQADQSAAAIADVTSDDATVDSANDANSAPSAMPGETFSLTVGLDTLTGGTGNDTFSALDNAGATTNTLTTGDTLDGGDGVDTLSIAASGTPAGGVTNGVSTSGIEAISVYNNSTAAYEVDAALMSGLTDVYINGGTNATSFTSVSSLPNLHLISTNQNATVTTTAATVSGSADEAIILSNGSAQTASITATYNGLETINFAAAGTTGAYSLGVTNNSLTLASTDLETVVVTGDADANVTVSLAGASAETQTSTFDASAAGGSITAHVTKGASATAVVTMSAQDDHLDFNGALANTITLDGGDGVDMLELDTDLAYSTAAATAGTAQAGAGVSNFESLYLGAGTDVDERALTNNAGITSVIALGAGSYTKSTALASVTQLSTGAFTTTVATDGAEDALTMNLVGAGVTSTLSAADVESLTVVSGGAAANTVTMSAAGSADLTSVTAAGTRGLTLNISGTKIATVDASGVDGIGSAFTLAAGSSTADMTVTASPNRPTVSATGIANTITTGDGDDTITGGDYRDDITAGDGNNTITAGDGDNQITTGRDDDTITAGDGDNTINSGNGDDTVTVGDGDNGLTLGSGDDTVVAGGTTTSSTIFDTNTVDLGAGDDSYTGGAGTDVVTLGSGDDTVDTGAGTDSIIMSNYDDDDVVDGGDGTDTISATALASATTMATTGAQIQAAGVHVDMTPGTSRTSTPQFTGIEEVYINANIAAGNDGASTDLETIDFSTSSGISNLYLLTTDPDGANNSTLVLNEVDAAAIHLQDDGVGALGQLTVVGTGQASLTLKGHDMADSTDLVVSDVDAVTLSSYVDNATATVTDTAFGDVTADDAESVTVSGLGVDDTVGAQAFTVGTISADAAETLTLSAGSNMTLTVGAIDTAGDDLQTIDIDVSDDGVMDLASITATAGDIEASTMTIDVGIGGDFGQTVVAGATTVPVVISADEIATVTVTVAAAATLRADFLYEGTTTITAEAGSTIDIDDIGVASVESSLTLSGRATVTGDLDLLGEATFNFSGLNSTGGALTIDGDSAGDKTIIGNNEDNTINTGAGADTVTGGAGVDTITTLGGIDTINGGGGADIIDGGALGDVINGGDGADVIHIDAATDSQGTAGTQTTLAGVDVLTLGTGDTVDLAGFNATAVIGATATVQTVTLAAGAEATWADVITGINTLTNLVNEVTLVKIVDDTTDTTGDGDFDGYYLVANDAVGAAIDVDDDVIIKLVGVDDDSVIAGVTAADVVSFTL